MKKILWVTWEAQRRNKEIAEYIGADFYQFDEIWKYSRLKRYAVGLWKTFTLFRKEKPDTIIVQNPSIVLALEAVVLKHIFHYQVGIDTHNGGFVLDSLDAKSKILTKILRTASHFIQRRADFIIAHNDELREFVADIGGKVIALPDKIPEIKHPDTLVKLDGKYNFFFICSYAEDEPYNEVIQAFQHLGNKYHVYISGNYHKKKINPSNYNENIHFLGRVPLEEFDQMLYSVDAVLDLTTREMCLLCGAYEAVAAEVPMVLSDTKTLKDYFSAGAVYTTNSIPSLVDNIEKMSEDIAALTKEVKALKHKLNENWIKRADVLRKLL